MGSYGTGSFFRNLVPTLSEEDAKKIWTELDNFLSVGEDYRSRRKNNEDDNMRIYRGDVWSDADKAWFKDNFAVEPYNIKSARAHFNTLITKQRNRRFKFNIVPQDANSYNRYLASKNEWMQKNATSGEFATTMEAEDFFDKQADDKVAAATSAYLNTIRNMNNASYVESDVFENGLITGQAFFKAIYSRRHTRDTSVDIDFRPSRQMLYDEATLRPDLTDVEFIGETQKLYKTELQTLYPQHKDVIEEHYRNFSNQNYYIAPLDKESNYKNYFDTTTKVDVANPKITVSELWILKNEPRFTIYDKLNNDEWVAKFDTKYEEISDLLITEILQERKIAAERIENPDLRAEAIKKLAPDFNPGIVEEISAEATERFQVTEILEPVFYKAVFSYELLLEYERSPLPHNSHPYMMYACQWTDGKITGLVDDVKDIIMMLNKALMFREIMMAHGTKGLLVVDEKALAESGMSPDDFKDQSTRIGGTIFLSMKGIRANKRLSDIIMPLTTVGQGLAEIQSIIADYNYRLNSITGVGQAQLGESQGETPTSRYKIQLAEGENANGLIFDNFIRSLTSFYKMKVVPLLVHEMRVKKKKVIRVLGDPHRQWIEVDFDESFNLFEDAIRNGMYSTELVPVNEDPQYDKSIEAIMFNLAQTGAIPIDVAFKYSLHPERWEIIRDLKKYQYNAQKQQMEESVDLETLKKLIFESGIPFEQAEEMIKKAKLETIGKKLAERQAVEGRQIQSAQGMSAVQSQVGQGKAADSRVQQAMNG